MHSLGLDCAINSEVETTEFMMFEGKVLLLKAWLQDESQCRHLDKSHQNP